uniref:Uncharacterized protein n=1 Tax=viral metagenome TaxID=1070528 RepID=A0A6H2A263_9ZZZZ
MKKRLKAEQDCASICIDAVEKLFRVYYKETSGDSVAEAQGKRAVHRTLTLVFNFAHDIYHIGIE